MVPPRRTGTRVAATLGVLTFRRNALLKSALDSFAAMDIPSDVDLEVLVVDNAPDQQARSLVEDYPAPWPLRYVHEPAPGVVAGRNRAASEAEASDVLLFADDDQVADASWLRELIAAWRLHGADAVAGPVLSSFSVVPPRWIVQGGYFDRRRWPTGTAIDRSGAGNLLLSRSALAALGPEPFDPAFATTGGEDSFLTQRLVLLGCQLVWCDEAIMIEDVGPERLTARWVFRRAFRTAGSSARCRLRLEPRPGRRLRVRVRCVVGGGLKAVAGVGMLALAWHPRWPWHRAIRLTCVGAGLSAGACGFITQEYAVRRTRSR